MIKERGDKRKRQTTLPQKRTRDHSRTHRAQRPIGPRQRRGNGRSSNPGVVVMRRGDSIPKERDARSSAADGLAHIHDQMMVNKLLNDGFGEGLGIDRVLRSNKNVVEINECSSRRTGGYHGAADKTFDSSLDDEWGVAPPKWNSKISVRRASILEIKFRTR